MCTYYIHRGLPCEVLPKQFPRFIRQHHNSAAWITFSLLFVVKPCQALVFGYSEATVMYHDTVFQFSSSPLVAHMTEYPVEMGRCSLTHSPFGRLPPIVFSQIFIHTMRTSFLASERGRTHDSSGVAIAYLIS
jgi:hypothetical protein